MVGGGYIQWTQAPSTHWGPKMAYTVRVCTGVSNLLTGISAIERVSPIIGKASCVGLISAQG